MARIELEQFIRATPQQVWPILCDLQSQEHWMVDVRGLRITSEQQSGAGTVLDMRTTLFGLPLLHDVMEITGWDEPSELRVLHRGQFSGSGGFLLEPVTGGTLWTWWEEFQPPLGSLGELVFRLAVRAHLRRLFGRSMQNLRQLVEQASNPQRPAGT